MSASAPLFPPCYSFPPAMLSWEMHSFRSQMLSAVWTPGLCSWVQSFRWPGLPYLGRLLEMCLPAWIKPCHQSTFICRLLVLSQGAADSLKAGVLGARPQAALCSVWVRNRRLVPKPVPASLLVLSNPCDSDSFFLLACLSALFHLVVMKSVRAASDATCLGFRAASPFDREGCSGTIRLWCSSMSCSCPVSWIMGMRPLYLCALLLLSVQCGWWQLLFPAVSAKPHFFGALEAEIQVRVGKCPSWLLPLSCQQDVLRCLNIDAHTEEIVAFFQNRQGIYGVKHPRAVCQHCVGHSCSSLVPAHGNCSSEKPSFPACPYPGSWKPSKTMLWAAQRDGFTGESIFLFLGRNTQPGVKIQWKCWELETEPLLWVWMWWTLLGKGTESYWAHTLLPRRWSLLFKPPHQNQIFANGGELYFWGRLQWASCWAFCQQLVSLSQNHINTFWHLCTSKYSVYLACAQERRGRSLDLSLSRELNPGMVELLDPAVSPERVEKSEHRGTEGAWAGGERWSWVEEPGGLKLLTIF